MAGFPDSVAAVTIDEDLVLHEGIGSAREYCEYLGLYDGEMSESGDDWEIFPFLGKSVLVLDTFEVGACSRIAVADVADRSFVTIQITASSPQETEAVWAMLCDGMSVL